MFLARLRRLLARRPWLHWLAVGSCAALAWWLVAAAEQSVDATRASWGERRTVWVATADIARGEPFAVEPRELPLAALPAAAVERAPTGAATRDVGRGEIVVAADVAGPATPAGWVVVAVAASGGPRLVPGDAVLVLAGGQARAEGVVTSVTAEAVEIAVPRGDAPVVAADLAAGGVTLARIP